MSPPGGMRMGRTAFGRLRGRLRNLASGVHVVTQVRLWMRPPCGCESVPYQIHHRETLDLLECLACGEITPRKAVH